MIKGKRSFLANLLYRTGVYRGLQRLDSKNLVIFNYHRIKSSENSWSLFDEGVYGPTQSELRTQLTWLKENKQIISEKELIDHVQGVRPLPDSSVMITFDDGYRDNADLALPVLKELLIPAIFFISTQAIQKRELGWWDTISYLVKQCDRPWITLRGKTFQLHEPKKDVIHELQEWMRTLQSDSTRFLMNEISEACGVPLPGVEITSQELMSWDQIREASNAGVTIGSHTHTHRVLSTLSLEDQLEEFRISKEILERELDKPVLSVAYPVGGHCDCHPETGVLAQKSGYQLGFTFQTGFNYLNKMDRFGIRRVSSEETIPLTCLAASLPVVFARSRCGDESSLIPTQETSMINPSLQPQNPGLLRGTTFLMLMISLALGPAWQAQAVERSREENDTNSAEKMAGTDDEDSTSSVNGNDIISPGFKLHLSCREDAKIDGDVRVGLDGKVTLPYDFTVVAGGQRLKTFEKTVEKKLQYLFKKKPTILVRIKQKRYWVKVLGLVKNPGAYLVKDHQGLDEVLAMASVKTEDLSSGFVRVGSSSHFRWVSMEDYLRGGPARDLPAWQGGEQVLFQLERPENDSSGGSKTASEPVSPSERKIQVLGEVRNPGPVTFQTHADGYYYLTERGGPTRDSDLGKIEVIRKDPKTNEHRSVSLGDLGGVKNVQESDIIIVHPDRPSGFEKILTSTSLIATIVSAVVLTVFVARNK